MKLVLLAILAFLAVSLVGCGSQADGVDGTHEPGAAPSVTPSPTTTHGGMPSHMSADAASRVTPSPTATPTAVAPDLSGLPPRLVEFLRDRQYGEIIHTGLGGWYDIQYFPHEDSYSFTVRLGSDRIRVEQDVRDFFAGFGVADLTTLIINWCEINPAWDPDRGIPRWLCSLTPGK